MKSTLSTIATIALLLLHSTADAQQSRLVAKATRAYSGSAFTLTDTTTYFYSNPRGGDLVHPLNYDSAITRTVTGSGLTLHHRIVKHYDSSGVPGTQFHLLVADADYWLTGITGLNGAYKYIVDYYATGKPQSVTAMHMNTSGAWDIFWRDSYFHINADTNVGYMVSQVGTGSTWANTSRREFAYDTLRSNFCQQIDYDYTEGTFYSTDDFDYSYRSGNNLQTSTRFLWDGTGFSNVTSKFFYRYDSTSHLLTSKTLIKFSASGSFNDSLSLYSNFTAAGMPLTEIDQKWNGSAWVNAMRYTYTYNTFNQVTTKLAETWTGSAWVTGPYLWNYYYSPYTPSEVATIDEVADVNIFPNPAGNIFTLRVNMKDAMAFIVAMYDMTGKEVYNTYVPLCDRYIIRIPTRNFPAGNYLLKVATQNNVTTRQVVVAH